MTGIWREFSPNLKFPTNFLAIAIFNISFFLLLNFYFNNLIMDFQRKSDEAAALLLYRTFSFKEFQVRYNMFVFLF